MVSHWRLSDSKFPQVSRTLLSILADRNNAVVWIASTRPLISKTSSFCTNPVPSAPITIGIIVTFMFHSFPIPLQGQGTYLSFHFLLLSLCRQPGQQSRQFSKFFCWLSLGLVVWPRFGDPFVSQSPRGVCASHSPGQILGCAFVVKFKFLAKFPVDHLGHPVVSSLLLFLY